MPRKKVETGFGESLRWIREARGLTREQLAAKSGVRPRTIEDYERGKSQPGWSAVIDLGRALGVTPDAFLPESNTPEPVAE